MNPLDEIQVILDRLKMRVADGTLAKPEFATISFILPDGEQFHHTVYTGRYEVDETVEVVDE